MALSMQMGRNVLIDDGLHFGNKPSEFLILSEMFYFQFANPLI